jgi:hypothetical protein
LERRITSSRLLLRRSRSEAKTNQMNDISWCYRAPQRLCVSRFDARLPFSDVHMVEFHGSRWVKTTTFSVHSAASVGRRSRDGGSAVHVVDR